MKVCLIFPAIRNFWGFNSLGKHPESIYINHGLASISAVLKQHGHEVSLIDLRECVSWNDVYHNIAQRNADLYGVYMSTLDFHEAKKVGDLVHKYGKSTIVGGPHPSICPEHVLNNTSFDYVFVGEAEKTLPDFIENPFDYGRLIIGEHPNLDELPYEDREIFNMKKILTTKHPFYPQPFITIISGRGCPYNCSFCKPGEDKIFGKFRMRSIEHFMSEIDMLAKKYKHRMLMIDDDSFTIKPNYVQEFCDAYKYIERPFTCQTRVDFIVNNPDLVKRMKEVGLWMFVIGFESFNQRILNLYRKGTTVEQNFEAAKVCHKHGIKIWANYMLGAPGEQKEEVLDTIRGLKKIKPTHDSPSFFTPICGTDLYDYCKEHDLLLSDDPADLGTRSPTAPKIKGIDYDWLQKQVLHTRLYSFFSSPQRMVNFGMRILRKMVSG